MNVERCEKKLAVLLVEGSTTCKSQRNKHKRIRNNLKKLKSEKPQHYNTLMSVYINVLGEFEKAVTC